MKILVINSGSSSIKYQLFEMEQHQVLASGLVERIGEEVSCFKYENVQGKKIVKEDPIANHSAGLEIVVAHLIGAETGVIQKKEEVGAVGHRVVHGGESFQKPTVVDEKVLEAIRENIPLAPLHNPANVTGIEVASKIFPGASQVAIFDTAFHQSMPEYAYSYALDRALSKELRIRRYGFHGTSHQYVAREAAKFLQKDTDKCNLITAHLGNGASIAAIKNGKSVDTSMGMTPLEGLIMGTRCGDLDPAIHLYLHNNKNMSLADIDKLMNKQSGIKGICGINDMRDVEERNEKGEELAKLALDMYVYRIKKYIGAYLVTLESLDALIFTAGIGENSSYIREHVCKGMDNWGISLDLEKNNIREKKTREIQKKENQIKVLVVPTNEELEIAKQTQEILK